MAKKHTVSETNETISAVITALGEGAVGIIRISGTDAAIGDKLFRSASGKIDRTYTASACLWSCS